MNDPLAVNGNCRDPLVVVPSLFDRLPAVEHLPGETIIKRFGHKDMVGGQLRLFIFFTVSDIEVTKRIAYDLAAIWVTHCLDILGHVNQAACNVGTIGRG